MAVIRRNAKWLSAAALLLLMGLGAWGLLSWHAPSARADETYTALDPVDAAQIGSLRAEIGVADDGLATLNPDAEQAETVLAAVRSWYETNSATLQQKRSALADQRALVRHYRSAINLGQDAADNLATAESRLAQLESDYDSYVAGARTTIWQQLSGDQQTLANRMRLQAAVPMPYRALDLSAGQKSALDKAQLTYRKRLAFAEDDQQRSQARTAYEEQMSDTLGPDNLSALTTLRGYLGSASEIVATAVRTVLPSEQDQG